MYVWYHLQQSYMNQPGNNVVANTAGGQLNNREEMKNPLSPFAPKIWFREMGSVIPSRDSLFILDNTQSS